MGTKATIQQKAALVDRLQALYPRFVNGEIEQEPFLDDLQAWIEGKPRLSGLLLPIPEYSDVVKAAAEIMGKNFHGPEAAHAAFGIPFMTKNQKVAAAMPFSPEVLKKCRETHILVWLAPLSLMGIWTVNNPMFYSKSDPWYGQEKEEFARIKVKAGWYLIRKGALPDSTSRTWDEQQNLLSTDEEVPSAAAMAQAILVHYLATGERLFESLYVRTSDMHSDGSRVYVGRFDAGGLIVYSHWDDDRSGGLGLAASRKSS